MNQQIALQSLVLSPINVRKVESNIAELSANILANGLIQNLSAVKNGSMYEVVAGGRRLKALQSLLEQGKINSDYAVSVKVVDASEAVNVSLSENVSREQMHPADEYDAFKSLVDSGISVEAVATQFGVTPNAVNRRLKLANIAPSIMQAFRDGEIAIDKLMALATTEDHELQKAVWQEASDYEDASDLREAILDQGQQVTSKDKLAVFVGIEAYEQAGGVVQADLFSEDNQDGYLLVNTSILTQLAKAKIQAIADEMLGSNSVAWVDTSIERSSREYNKYRIAQTELSELPAIEQAKVDDCENRIKALEAEQEELDSDLESHDDEYDSLAGQIEALDGQADEIKAPFWQFDEAEKPFLGKFIGLNREGQIEVTDYLIRREDEAQIKRVDLGAEKVGDEKLFQKAKKPDHPTSLITALTAHRTIALQATIAHEPQKALVILVAKLLMGVVDSYGSLVEICKVSPSNVMRSLPRHDATIKTGSAFIALEAIHEKWAYLLDSKDLLKDLEVLEQSEILSLLAYLTAISVDTVSFGNGESKSYKSVGKFVGLELNDWFTPTPVNYWGKLGKEFLIKKIIEKEPKTEGLAKMKRGDLAELANRLYEDSGYQPDFMEV